MGIGRDAICEAVVLAIEPTVRGLRDRITELEKRLAETETRAMRFCGIWQKALTYGPGNAVTHDGGVWVCTRATDERPGTGDGWQLAVKAGKGA
jgi:hypothetical protein